MIMPCLQSDYNGMMKPLMVLQHYFFERHYPMQHRSRYKHILPVLLALVLLAGLGSAYFLHSLHRPFRVLVPSYSGDTFLPPMENWLRICGVLYDVVAAEDAPADSIDIRKYDALILPGGADIGAALYGQENHPDNDEYNTLFDRFEIDLALRFAEDKRPILGVCRGEQILNVAFGGTLIQQMPTGHYRYRLICTDPSGWLYEALGQTEYVRHIHHQCVDQLGEGLIADQWDFSDGTIEGFHHESLPIYAVQWHPETYPKTRGLVMEAFRDICMQERKKRMVPFAINLHFPSCCSSVKLQRALFL